MNKVIIKEITVNDYISASKLPSADYVINPYVGCRHKCIYCYAEFMKRFTGHNEEWGDFTDVKMCSKPINLKKIENSSVLIASVTDAYNPYEHKFKITQSILKQLANCNANIEILTKSSLVTRDIDLLNQIPNVRVGISMNSLDDGFRKQIEPFASSVEKRIGALKLLHESGINTYLFMSPIFPEITDFKEIVNAVKDYTDVFCFENLNLRAGYLPRVLNYIEKYYPHLSDLYREIYIAKNMNYWENLSDSIDEYCSESKINYKMYFYHDKIKKK